MLNLKNNFLDSGKIKLNMPDFRDAKRTFEQTADCIKSTFEWANGLIVIFTTIAGKIDINTNGKIVKVTDKEYKIEYGD